MVVLDLSPEPDPAGDEQRHQRRDSTDRLIEFHGTGGFGRDRGGVERRDAGTGYDQVTGAVDLTNAPVLVARLGFVPSQGQVFTIVDNDGGDAVMGAFSGLGESVTIAAEFSVVLQVSDVGGDGNDVTLTAVAVPRIWTGAVNNLWSEAGNWTGGIPGAGDLQFPISASNKTMLNDLPGGTAFQKIEWLGTGYSISGNGFGLTNGIANSGTNTIGVDLTLTGGSVSGGSLTLAGNVNSTSTTATFASVGGSVTQSSGSMTTGAVTGSVTLSGGGLSASSVGGAPITIGGATLTIGSAYAGAVTLTGNATVSGTLNGPIDCRRTR